MSCFYCCSLTGTIGHPNSRPLVRSLYLQLQIYEAPLLMCFVFLFCPPSLLQWMGEWVSVCVGGTVLSTIINRGAGHFCCLFILRVQMLWQPPLACRLFIVFCCSFNIMDHCPILTIERDKETKKKDIFFLPPSSFCTQWRAQRVFYDGLCHQWDPVKCIDGEMAIVSLTAQCSNAKCPMPNAHWKLNIEYSNGPMVVMDNIYLLFFLILL